MRYFALVAGFLFVAISGLFTELRTLAGEGELRESHRGITLMAVPPVPGFDYDIKIIDGRQALDKIRDALDVLLDKSPYSAAAIEKLRRNGEITIIYNPRFPPKVVSSNELNYVALFALGLSDYSSGRTGSLVFPVVMSRYLVKWKRDEIAAVLAHELVGHGTQYLEGRPEKMTERDFECEANLYKEKAFQDIGVDKRNELMIRFRENLERIWCKSFKDYMAAHTRKSTSLWKKLNPDVPELIAVFKQYVLTKDIIDEIYRWFGDAAKRYEYRSLDQNKAGAVCINWEETSQKRVAVRGFGLSWKAETKMSARQNAYRQCKDRRKKQNWNCKCVIIFENDKRVVEFPKIFLSKIASM